MHGDIAISSIYILHNITLGLHKHSYNILCKYCAPRPEGARESSFHENSLKAWGHRAAASLHIHCAPHLISVALWGFLSDWYKALELAVDVGSFCQFFDVIGRIRSTEHEIQLENLIYNKASSRPIGLNQQTYLRSLLIFSYQK